MTTYLVSGSRSSFAPGVGFEVGEPAHDADGGLLPVVAKTGAELRQVTELGPRVVPGSG